MQLKVTNYLKSIYYLAIVLFTVLSLASCNGDGSGGGTLTVSVQDVVKFEISPDGQKVAYLSDQDFDDVFELFVVNTHAAGASRCEWTTTRSPEPGPHVLLVVSRLSCSRENRQRCGAC